MTKKIAATKTEKSEKRYKYRTDGSGFALDKMAPDAAEGEYVGALKRAEVKPTKKDQYPMLQLDWQLTEAISDSDDAQRSVKAYVKDYIVFFPESEGRKGNMSKRQLRQLLDLLDLDHDLVPTLTDGANDEDFQPLIDALLEKGGEGATIWVALEDDKRSDSGEQRAVVRYTAPRGAIAASPTKDEDEDEDEDEEEAKPAKKAAKPAAKPAKVAPKPGKVAPKPADEDDDEDDEDDVDEDDEDEDEDEAPPPKKKAKR